MTLSCS